MNRPITQPLVIAISSKLFYICKNKTMFIINENGDQLCRRVEELKPKTVLSYSNVIVALFSSLQMVADNDEKMNNYLKIYNIKLETLFECNFLEEELQLCAITTFDIICWSRTTSQCIILSINNLKQVERCGQLESPLEPFYFKDGIIIDSSDDIILFYHTNMITESHLIKLISRQTGHHTASINLDFNYLTKMVKIDPKTSHILIKFIDDIIEYFDSNGNLLSRFKNNKLSNFNRIEFNHQNDLVFYDKLKILIPQL
jgi:hypothetical protein